MTQIATKSKFDISPAALAGLGMILVSIGWAFWPTLAGLAHKWWNDPGYSHGILVPFFCLYLLWLRRESLTFGRRAVGPALAFLIAAVVLRGVGGLFVFVWFDSVALLPCFVGIVLLLGGWSLLRATWPAIAFLFFAIPLPYRFEVALGGPLQTIAARCSTFMLQTLGQPAIREGNTIMLNDIKLGIVEACSGLRMLVTFFAFSSGVAFLVRRPLLDKFCIIMSAVPIALATNVIRITATGMMYQFNEKFAHRFFHDFAGWFMMPVCLAFLGLEIWMLNRLIIDNRPSRPVLLPTR